MRKIRITSYWRDYSYHYQIDDGENLSSLEMVVAELNDGFEPKIDENDQLTQEFKEIVTTDTYEIYLAMQESNEVEYKGKKIVRFIDRDEYVDTEQKTFKYFGDKLVEALSWVKTSFIPMYSPGFKEVDTFGKDVDVYQQFVLDNKNIDNPPETAVTLLTTIKIEILK